MERCAICLMDLENNKNTLTLDCGHCFMIKCYTDFVIHKIKESNKINLINGFGVHILCPICRKEDLILPNSFISIMKDNIDSEIGLDILTDELEYSVLKEFIPHLLCVINTSRLDKRSMINVLNSVISSRRKELKNLLKDIKN